MTGKEAWSIVSPIISAHMVPYRKGGKRELDVLDDAYVVVYGALQEHDKKIKQEAKEKK